MVKSTALPACLFYLPLQWQDSCPCCNFCWSIYFGYPREVWFCYEGRDRLLPCFWRGAPALHTSSSTPPYHYYK